MITPHRTQVDSRTAVIIAQSRRAQEAKEKAPVVEISPSRKARLEAIRHGSPSADTLSLRRRVLAALEGGPVTTFELQRHLDVYDPRPSVMALRRAGHEIVTRWVRVATECGHLHRVGEYALVRHAAITNKQPES